jgi:hypothetical protein
MVQGVQPSAGAGPAKVLIFESKPAQLSNPPTPSAVERAGTLNDIILTLQQSGIMDLERATQVS